MCIMQFEPQRVIHVGPRIHGTNHDAEFKKVLYHYIGSSSNSNWETDQCDILNIEGSTEGYCSLFVQCLTIVQLCVRKYHFLRKWNVPSFVMRYGWEVGMRRLWSPVVKQEKLLLIVDGFKQRILTTPSCANWLFIQWAVQVRLSWDNMTP